MKSCVFYIHIFLIKMISKQFAFIIILANLNELNGKNNSMYQRNYFI